MFLPLMVRIGATSAAEEPGGPPAPGEYTVIVLAVALLT